MDIKFGLYAPFDMQPKYATACPLFISTSVYNGLLNENIQT